MSTRQSIKHRMRDEHGPGYHLYSGMNVLQIDKQSSNEAAMASENEMLAGGLKGALPSHAARC